MDFITQNLLGAVAGHAVAGRARGPDTRAGVGRWALVAGAVGGALPDFDFLLKPLADPALPFEYHRHLTHALVFIPIGGFLAALPFLLARRGREQFKTVLLATTAGCATHGLLDNMTSYGTHLFWPFVSHRTAWDSMSIIDPIFTGLLVLTALIALICGRAGVSRIGLATAGLYIAFGFVQHARALDAQHQLAEERGHAIEHGRVMPTLGNVFVFRSLYLSDGVMHADAIRVSPIGGVGVREGTSLPVLGMAELPNAASPRVKEVVEGLRAFATGFIARDPRERDDGRVAIGDMRISTDTAGFQPLWGISLAVTGDPDPRWQVEGRRNADAGQLLAELWDDVFDRRRAFRPVAEIE